MDINVLLDTLVTLASLGASGVCIFAIFWTGWLIMHLPPQADPQRHKTLRFFMVICVLIASVSAGSGYLNAKHKAETIQKQTQQIAAKQDQVQQLEGRHEKVTTYLLRSLEPEKRAKVMREADPEVKTDIQKFNLNAIQMQPTRPTIQPRR